MCLLIILLGGVDFTIVNKNNDSFVNQHKQIITNSTPNIADISDSISNIIDGDDKLVEYSLKQNVDGYEFKNVVIDDTTVTKAEIEAAGGSKDIGSGIIVKKDKTEFNNITSDHTITANYGLIDYNISYNLQDGESTTNPTTYTKPDSPITLSDAVKEGYTFNGWYDNEELTGTPVTQIDAGTIGDINLWPKFTINQYDYTIKYQYQNINDDNYTTDTDLTEQGKEVFNRKITIDDSIIRNANHLKNGFDYVGSENNPMTIQANDNNEMLLKYNRKKYNVLFDVNGGTLPFADLLQEVRYEGKATDPTDKASNPGYILTSWKKDDGSDFDFDND